MFRIYNSFTKDCKAGWRNSFNREIRRITSHKLYIFIIVGIPLFSLIFMATIFGNGQMENLPIGIVDKSNSFLSREIIRATASTPTFKVSEKHFYNSEKEAIDAVQKMDIYGFLVIPDNFEKDFHANLNPTISYFYHYAILAVGGELNGGFSKTLGNLSAQIIKTKADEVGMTPIEVKSVILPTNTELYPVYNSNLDYSVFLSYPFFFVFFQILILVFIVYAIGSDSTKEWLQSGGGNIYAALTGKILPYLIIFLSETTIANYVLFAWLKIPFACGFFPLLASSILLVLATISLAVIIVALIPKLGISISIASMIGAMGATTSGVTFPVESMSKFFEIVCHLFPIRYFVHINHNLLYENIGIEYSWPYFAALILFMIPAILIAPKIKKFILRNGSIHLPVLYAVGLIVIGGTLGYGFLYNLMYKPNIVKQVPVAVVDNSKTALSREYTRELNSTQGLKVLTNSTDFIQAQELMKSNKVRGIIYIPQDFDNQINNNNEAVFLMYQTTTSFLYYLAIQEAAAKTMQHINNKLRTNIVESLTLEQKFVLSQAPSVTIKGIPLYNKNEGYGTFLLPIVFIIIIFQTMLMATGVLFGDKTIKATKFIPYMIIGYFLLSIFLTGLLPIIFNLPHIGNSLLIYPFILLFIIATAAMAYAASPLFTEAETVNLLVPFFSIGLIFLSGLSFPREQIPLFWRWVYYIFPSSAAVTGYIKLNSMGGDFSSILPEIKILFAQLIFYTLFYLTISKKFLNLPIKQL